VSGSRVLDILPSELPDIERPAVDTEDGTIDKVDGALYPDDGARVADVSVGWHDPDTDEPVCAAWRFWDAGGHGGALPRREWDYLMDWLRARRGLVFHNSLYDIIMLGTGTGNGYPGVDLIDHVCWDTLLVAAFLDTGQRAGLEEQEKLHFHSDVKASTVGEIKKWLADARRAASKERNAENARRRKEGLPNIPATDAELRYASWAYYLAPWDLVKPYAASDAGTTIRLARLQWHRLAEGQGGRDGWKHVAHDLDIMRTLLRMERRGIPYNAAKSLEIADQLAIKRDQLFDQLPFGKPTPKNLAEWFFDQHKVKPLKVSKKTGNPSCDAETITMMSESGVPGAKELFDYKKVDGAENRWYRAYAGMVGADGRLRPRFRQTSVRSGRLSIERVQLQAVPHNHVLRNIPVLAEYPTPRDLIPTHEPGWDRWEMDLAQAELRIAALLANAVTMLQIIRDGRDPHGELATTAFGVRKGDDEWFRYRQVGKRGNFSLIFGIGRDRLRADIRTQTGIELPWGDVDTLRDTFNDMHPEFRRKIRIESEKIRRGARTITLINGRKNGLQTYELDRDFDEDGNPYGPVKGMHKAFNRLVQGSIGEFAKAWMVEADAMLMEELADVDPDNRHGLLLQIHDALLMSVPEGERGALLAKRARQIGLDLWDKWFRLPLSDGSWRTVPGDIDYALWNQK
jgi:DNA polymerase I-like protein with 3'-5' exonuclease and polymerase domains